MLDKNKIYDDVIIYKLSCKNASILPFYIGSTTDLYSRIATHKHACNVRKKNRYLYSFINDFGGFENWKFDILAHHKKKNLKEKRDLEKSFLEMYNPQLNKAVIGRTPKEYAETFKEKIAITNSICHRKNLEKRRKYLRENYHRNRDKYLLSIKKTMEKNKEKYKQHRIFKVNCLCGCNTTYQHRHNHRRTNLHKEKMIEIKKEIIDKCTKLRSITKTKPHDSE